MLSRLRPVLLNSLSNNGFPIYLPLPILFDLIKRISYTQYVSIVTVVGVSVTLHFREFLGRPKPKTWNTRYYGVEEID